MDSRRQVYLRAVEVKNFRGIREIKLDEGEIGRVNLIVGRNNSCKSALLEALALAASFPTFRDALYTPLPTWVIVRRSKPYSARLLINVNSDEASIDVSTTNGNISLKLFADVSKVPEKHRGVFADLEERLDVNRRRFRDLRLRYFLRHLLAEVEEIITERFFLLEEALRGEYAEERIYAVAEKEGDISAFLLYTTSDLTFTIPRRKESTNSVAFLDSHLFLNTDILSRVIDTLIKYNIELFDRLVNMYRETVGKSVRVVDIRLTRERVPYVRFEEGPPVPYNVLGDGLKLSLFYTFASALVENGVVFMEEPEVHMHAGLIDMLVHHILNPPNTLQQYFISTHSLDLMHGLLTLAKDLGKISEVKVIRLSDCEVVDVLHGDEAYFKLEEIGQDLREI